MCDHLNLWCVSKIINILLTDRSCLDKTVTYLKIPLFLNAICLANTGSALAKNTTQ